MKNMYWKTYNTENIKGKYLFRFMSEEKLVQFLETGNLWFSRSDKFGDKMECVRLSDLMALPKPDFKEIEERKKRHLICCFHESNKESISLWDTHFRNGTDRRKYALKFERNQLTDLVERANSHSTSFSSVISLTHGKVKYKTLIGNSKERLIKKKIKHVAFRKETAFAYEREYRFDILLKTKFNELGVDYKIGNPELLSFKILVNPLLINEEYNKSIEKLKELNYYDKYEESDLAKWLMPNLW